MVALTTTTFQDPPVDRGTWVRRVDQKINSRKRLMSRQKSVRLSLCVTWIGEPAKRPAKATAASGEAKRRSRTNQRENSW
jgi:hypothetical protein